MSEIVIRKYKIDDETVLKNMVKHANPNYFGNLTEELANINVHKKLTVAEYNGIVAGYLWLSISLDNCQAFIFVSPEYRRRKIGTALCNEASKLCRENNEKKIWSMYYEYEIGKGFADKVGCYYTTSSIYMEYTGGMLPDYEKFKNIRNCREEDYLRCSYLWDKGYYEMQVRIGHPERKMREIPEDDKQNFTNNINNSYVIEKILKSSDMELYQEMKSELWQ